MKLWSNLRGWAGANAVAVRLCLRMTIAGLLAYVLAEFFVLPQGYWAVFSAIIVMQASVGGSIKATADHLIGTVGGALAGGAVAYLLPHASVLSLGVALVIALVPLTLVAALWPNYRIAPLTAVIVLLTPGAQQLGPLDSALYRIVEITLGSFIGLGVSLQPTLRPIVGTLGDRKTGWYWHRWGRHWWLDARPCAAAERTGGGRRQRGPASLGAAPTARIGCYYARSMTPRARARQGPSTRT